MSYRDKKYNTMIVRIVDGEIAIVQMNRPEALNAVNAEMIQERAEIYEGIAKDPEIKVMITTGNERAYCAGGDLKSFVNFGVKEAREFADSVVRVGAIVADMAKPTISMVAGVAFGGGLESLLNHDLRICADNAVFAVPEINVGIFPGGGGTQKLPQNMPINKAKEFVFFGEPFDAQTALQYGLVNKVVPLAELEETTLKWARKLCKKPPFSLRMAKEAINAAWSTSLEKGLQIETHGWAMCYGTQDQVEGMTAFIEKRKPNYTGK
jgi:enoyl-CoA hydratase/carnithine racemase